MRLRDLTVIQKSRCNHSNKYVAIGICKSNARIFRTVLNIQTYSICSISYTILLYYAMVAKIARNGCDRDMSRVSFTSPMPK